MNPADLAAELLAIARAAGERRGGDLDGQRTGRRARAPAQPRARRLGVEHRAEAREAARCEPARARGRARAASVRDLDGVASVDVAGPGFINITLDAAAAGALARTIVDAGDAYGRGDLYDGITINLEFVSANPTGPLHIGGVRWAAVGDSLARIFQAQGGDVTREYYFNDHGAQIDRFARSLLASYLGEPDARGRLRRRVHLRHRRARHRGLPGRPATSRAMSSRRCSGRWASSSCSATSRRACTSSASTSTCSSTRTTLHESGAVERAVERLRELGADLRGRRRDLGPHDRLRRRQRPGDHAATASRLHLGRPRLLPQQARARLRAQPHHARRRPPRLRRPPDGDDGGVRRRAVREPRDPDRPAREPRARRRAAAHVEARGHGRRRSRTSWRRSAWMPDATRWSRSSSTPGRHRPRPVGQAHQRQPRVLRAVRPRAHAHRSPATRPRLAWTAACSTRAC